MTDVTISSRAYVKMIFHAAKYPHLAVNGLLLTEKSAEKNQGMHIVDAVPLFHQCLQCTPMSEIALIEVEAKAALQGLQISGYYSAAENYYENSLERAPGAKIADKISENNNPTCFVVLDNKSVCLNMEYSALKVWHKLFFDTKWVKAKFSVVDSEKTLDAVSSLLQRGAMKELNDFDNYLDNTASDWSNEHLNRDLNQILAMH